jgi:hypothetical protein
MAIGALTGASAGALSGSLADYGIPDDFIRKLGETIPEDPHVLRSYRGLDCQIALTALIGAKGFLDALSKRHRLHGQGGRPILPRRTTFYGRPNLARLASA